jgi:septal ring-binding cell division protein DamX
VLQRLDALQLKSSAADKELAALDARVSAIAEPAGPSSVPESSGEPAVLEAQRYAIQLVVYTSRARIRPFASRYGIADQVSAILVRFSGRPAYAVVLGRYKSETEAREAIAELTPELQALRPWVRQLPAGTRFFPLD